MQKRHVDREAVRRRKAVDMFTNFDSNNSKEDKELMMYVVGRIHPGPHGSRILKGKKKKATNATPIEGLEINSGYQFGWKNSPDEKDATNSL